mgnify:FL=1|jgi:hypothetical protein
MEISELIVIGALAALYYILAYEKYDWKIERILRWKKSK